ncbi:MAG: DEAD/DEAH box helicase, partial [Clostridia bacterium]|nr:DEAD/DEAH box helicase [Clostridia bacterium]
KTVCAQGAMYLAAKNGYRSMLMAPTEILARQHFADTEPMMRKLGFRTALLCGSMKVREKAEVLRGLVSDDPSERIDMVIGTHALISDGVKCDRLGLIVTDEQHRFGVSQRAALSDRGEETPHVLVMSATPIPRTLSLALYGDLDVSRIDEMPPGRQKVDTFAVNESYRERLNGFIRKNVEEGGQVYIVCPSIEEAEQEDGEDEGKELEGILFAEESKPPLKAAVKYAEELKNGPFSDIPLAFLHGRMKSAEKDAIMLAFARGEIKILVSTTVIEVGVNVPNASLMIVENAERFGLSQLHQLRGRVGRGKRKSYCILVSDSEGENAKKRLNIMKKTCDGYEIAEMDLSMRGPGDFFAAAGEKLRQHGDTGLRLAASWQDVDTFAEADEEARLMKELDPRLEKPEHARLREAVFSSVDTNYAKLN